MTESDKEMNRVLRTVNGAGDGKYVGFQLDQSEAGERLRDAVQSLLDREYLEGDIIENVAHVRFTADGRETFRRMISRVARGDDWWIDEGIDPPRPTNRLHH